MLSRLSCLPNMERMGSWSGGSMVRSRGTLGKREGGHYRATCELWGQRGRRWRGCCNRCFGRVGWKHWVRKVTGEAFQGSDGVDWGAKYCHEGNAGAAPTGCQLKENDMTVSISWSHVAGAAWPEKPCSEISHSSDPFLCVLHMSTVTV